MNFLERIKAFFLKVFKPKPKTSSVEEYYRKTSFLKEKLRLASLKGRKEAREESKQKKQPKKNNFLDNLASFSNVIDNTFKPTIELKYYRQFLSVHHLIIVSRYFASNHHRKIFEGSI